MPNFKRDNRPKPTMHKTLCSECGEACEVPFKPNGKKPVLCNNCFRQGGDSEGLTMHKTTCSACGKMCEVPFRPSGKKPIYCKQCFGKEFTPKGPTNAYNKPEHSKNEFGILNSKLDRILKILDAR